MAGPALTVRTAPGDNLMVHRALTLAEKGVPWTRLGKFENGEDNKHRSRRP
jgi:hypothetical protein